MLSPTKILETIARFIKDCFRGISLSLKLGVAGELVESEYEEDSGKPSMDDSNCAGQMNYVDAARIGIAREPRKMDLDDPRLAAIEECLREVVLQFEREFGWRSTFKVEGRKEGFVTIYHLSIGRTSPWWSFRDDSFHKFLGSVVFRNTDKGGGWTSPVDAPMHEKADFTDLSDLSQAVEQLLASPEVGQILLKLFGRVRFTKIKQAKGIAK